jgi:hypothetical protein
MPFYHGTRRRPNDGAPAAPLSPRVRRLVAQAIHFARRPALMGDYENLKRELFNAVSSPQEYENAVRAFIEGVGL